ncbi:hypothetical protein [Aquimarina sp. LLG6339-5]|uniref:hypothetical protein n=1 Tax=Aquimarina sp. LLG6339-5 TaxID=3160830 RepID=UPI00386AADC9
MKRINFILILIALSTSCQNEKKLNGTWIYAYSYNPESRLSSINKENPFHHIISFKNGIYKMKGFKYYWYNDEQEKPIRIKGHKLFLSEDNNHFEEINPFEKDSIVFVDKSKIRNRVYKKLADSLKSETRKIELIGKKILRDHLGIKDTIKFINDSIYVSSSFKMGNSDLRWERINHNGFDILFTDGNQPYLIKKKKANNIYVSIFDTEKKDLIFKLVD